MTQKAIFHGFVVKRGDEFWGYSFRDGGDGWTIFELAQIEYAEAINHPRDFSGDPRVLDGKLTPITVTHELGD